MRVGREMPDFFSWGTGMARKRATKRLKAGGLYRRLVRGVDSGRRILLAVSGGGDSIALLHLALPDNG